MSTPHPQPSTSPSPPPSRAVDGTVQHPIPSIHGNRACPLPTHSHRRALSPPPSPVIDGDCTATHQRLCMSTPPLPAVDEPRPHCPQLSSVPCSTPSFAFMVTACVHSPPLAVNEPCPRHHLQLSTVIAQPPIPSIRGDRVCPLPHSQLLTISCPILSVHNNCARPRLHHHPPAVELTVAATSSSTSTVTTRIYPHPHLLMAMTTRFIPTTIPAVDGGHTAIRFPEC